MSRVKTLFAAPLLFLCLAVDVFAFQTHDKSAGFNEYACGPQVLRRVPERCGKPETADKLASLSGTQDHRTSLFGMKQALLALGVTAETFKIPKKDLPALSPDRLLICHTKRDHYLLVTHADETWVRMIDTFKGPEEIRIPLDVFSSFWDGVVLAVELKPHGSLPPLIALREAEAKQIIGGQPDCQNSLSTNRADNGTGSGQAGNSEKISTEPVNTINGNYFTERTDITMPGRGFPFMLTRIYNSQTTSDIAGWTPEAGGGSWVIEDGELSGEGDRFYHGGNYGDGSITLDTRTIKQGETYDYETAWVNFRWKDKDNRYAVILHLNGILELAKFRQAQRTELAEAANTMDPLQWNKIQIQTSAQSGGLRIRVSGNDIETINVLDTNPLAAGQVVLESYFCHAHYDNIVVADATGAKSYNFDADDNDTLFGYGWSTMLDCSVRTTAAGNLIVTREGGRKDSYTRLADGSYAPPAAVFDKLTKDTGGYTLLRIKENLFYRFDGNGQLVSVSDRNNNALQFQYAAVQVQ